jgi:prepilin-type processing-associated H-X9-DG protein
MMASRVEDPSQPLEYARPGLVGKRSRVRIIVGAVIASLVGAVLVTEVLIPSGLGSRPMVARVKCASNMRQIGQAISMYANDHNGQFPDDLQIVLENEDVTSVIFVCPESNDEPAVGSTTQATAAALLQPGHLSYIYLGKGVTTQTVTDDTVILYEPLANHASKGMNVMFGDFHVEWLSATDAATILKQVAADKRPVKVPARP